MPLTERMVIGAEDILFRQRRVSDYRQRRISDYQEDDSMGAESVDEVDDIEKTVVDMSMTDSEYNLEDRMQRYQ